MGLAGPGASPSRPTPAGWIWAAVAGLAVVLVAGALGWAWAGGVFQANGTGPGGAGGESSLVGGSPGASPNLPTPSPTPVPPIGGTELYGFLPYWLMNQTMVDYLAGVPVSTLALFSVTTTNSGSVRTTDTGYRRITGPIGQALIAGAHARHQRVELVYTSFGATANHRIFGPSPVARARHAIAAQQLATLALDLGFDGLDVDVERIDDVDVPGYAAFLVDLRSDLDHAGHRGATTISVATTADHQGAIEALDAVNAGVDRVFLMGYDYHWSGSSPGATAPIHSRDTAHDLTTSIVDYVQTGVPRTKILLGLPLYGMSWPVSGPDPLAVALGKGSTFIPSSHAAQLLAPGFAPLSDDQETAEWFTSQSGATWTATYYDSPRTLQPKLELARVQGLAGAGFWALGYERGLPGYLELMQAFRAGRVGG